MGDRRLQSIEAMVERQKGVLAEGHGDGFLFDRQDCRVGGFRPMGAS